MPDTGDILTALQFAAFKHRDQRRKDHAASPYINHPIALAQVLWHEGRVHEPAIICAALLHDTIEDTQTTAAELESLFGRRVTRIVLEVTDDKLLPKAERKRRQIEHAPHLSRAAKLVKLADKICNLRDVSGSPPPTWSLRRRRAYFDWARKVVAGVRGVNSRLESAFDAAFADRP
jgi:GTP diphosphokinase / guanosine-3',5'-bis(diphosphate) 3'-diphosphatase